MLEAYDQVIESSLDNTLKCVTAYCLKQAARQHGMSVAQTNLFAGRVRLNMSFIQQEDVEFVWVESLNTQGLVCSFRLGHELLMQIGDPSLKLQKLRWQLVYPANTQDDIMEASDSHLLDTALFRRIGFKFDDEITDVIETAIIEMSS